MNSRARQIKSRVLQAIQGEDEDDSLAVLAMLLAWFSYRKGIVREQLLTTIGELYDEARQKQDGLRSNRKTDTLH